MRKGLAIKTALSLLFAAFFVCLAGCGGLSSVVSLKSSADMGLVINEAVSSNKRSLVDEAMGSPDWIELYNGGSETIHLAGYGLTDSLRDLRKFSFPEGTTLAPGEYLVVYATANAGQESARFLTDFGLSKSGDFVFLLDPYYNLLQQLELPALLSDVSYARGLDGSYGYCDKPTPGAANDTNIFSSLEQLFSDQESGALRITEVMPAPPDGYPWVELYHAGSSELRLENYYLSDTEGEPLRWQLPAATLSPGDYLVIYLSGLDQDNDEFHTDFKLSKSDTLVTFSDSSGARLSSLRWDAGVPEGISVVEGDGVLYCATPTKGAANAGETFTSVVPTDMDQTDPVRINEVLRRNKLSITDADGERSEWVELYNGSQSAVSLAGYFLSDNPENLFKWALPDTELAAGGYYVVFLSGKNRAGSEPHASFSLGGDEPALYLTRISGMRMDTMQAPLDAGANVSVGRGAGGQPLYYAQPTPGYKNAQAYETADSIGFFNPDGVYISEVCAAGAATSRANDWIELYNGSAQPVELTGWYLSDDELEKTKWRIPQLVLEAGGYAVIETTSHMSRQTEQTANFGLSPAGETVFLVSPEGETADRFETGALSSTVSSGRIEGEASVARVFFSTMTRGKANDAAGACTGYAPRPVFSETGLYQSAAFTVSLSCRNEGASVYYTTDGSEPSTRDTLYEGPISVSRNTVLRAKAYAPGVLPSECASVTYLFETPHTMPVVSLMADPADLKTVWNATQFNKPERKASFQFFEKDGALGVEFDAGINAKGSGTLGYAQHSMAIHLRAAYGQSSVTYPFFENCALHTFSALALRNSGQDMSVCRLKDTFFSRAVQGMHIENQQTRLTVVYINGAYHGIYDLIEDLNKDYLNTHYGVDTDTVEIIRRNSAALQGNNDDFLRVRAFAVNRNLASDATFAEFAEWVDVQYFTDYMIAQTYFNNTDMFNQKYWRTTDYAVKWRPIYYDLDFGLSGYSGSMISNYFDESGVPSANGSLTYMDIYVGLNKNAAWRAMAAERYVELIVTQFAPARLTAILDALADEMRPEMARHIRLWGRPGSVSEWEQNVAKLRHNVEKRPEYALESVRRFFGLSKAELQTLVDRYS